MKLGQSAQPLPGKARHAWSVTHPKTVVREHSYESLKSGSGMLEGSVANYWENWKSKT